MGGKVSRRCVRCLLRLVRHTSLTDYSLKPQSASACISSTNEVSALSRQTDHRKRECMKRGFITTHYQTYASCVIVTPALPERHFYLRAYRYGTRGYYYILYINTRNTQYIVAISKKRLILVGSKLFVRRKDMNDAYPVSKTNKVRQLRELAAYDKEVVYSILNAGLVGHVAFIQDGNPIVVPMIYGRDGDTVYLHGARKARIIRLLEESQRICMNVTLLDGIVYARSVFNSSMNYRSATLFGKPQLLKDSDEKLAAMKHISEHTMPGRWNEVRESHEKEVKMTGVISLVIETASAKISAGNPDDEEEDYSIPIWAGILPITTTIGPQTDDDRLVPGVLPSEVILAMQNRIL